MKLTDEIRAQIKAQLTASPKKTSKATARGYKFTPHASEALGVAPEQIAEATAHLRSHGITADFDSQGRCVITSEKQYREVAKASGLWNGRDGYGAKDSEGRAVHTGRDLQRKKDEFRRAVLRGDFDF